MTNQDEIKKIVKEKYGDIAQTRESSSSCCDETASFVTVMSDNYSGQEGYQPEADLGLGCGIPTAFANLREGMTVLDLGSGAGNDVFIAAKIVGPAGKVIGIDMTEQMIGRAETNKKKSGIEHVEFRLGEIEALPVESHSIDVVISNCVLNLVPDKRKAFSEIYRVLKPGGYFTVSDIVVEGTLPSSLRKLAEAWAGCVAGALEKKDYLTVASQVGFTSITIEKEKTIPIPVHTVKPILKSLSLPDEIDQVQIKSITVTAVTPTHPSNDIVRRATVHDLEVIRNLLSRNELPDIELEKYISCFIIIERDGVARACGGLEIHDTAGLIRSVAVAAEHHHEGLGTKIYEALEIDAKMFFLNALYLFTNTAAGFFTKLGYEQINRGQIPQALHESGEFKHDCCEHAVVMKKTLSQFENDADFPSIELPIVQSTSCCG